MAVERYHAEQGPYEDLKRRLQSRYDFIQEKLDTWPAAPTTNAEALQRITFLLNATRGLAENQQEIIRLIRDRLI